MRYLVALLTIFFVKEDSFWEIMSIDFFDDLLNQIEMLRNNQVIYLSEEGNAFEICFCKQKLG